MAMLTGSRSGLSELGRDLALSEVRLAALRALSLEPPVEREMRAADALARELSREISLLNAQVDIPAAAIPAEEVRHQLESMLSGLVGERRRVSAGSERALQLLLDSLRPLADGRLSKEEAASLLEALHRIGEIHYEAPHPPEVDLGR